MPLELFLTRAGKDLGPASRSLVLQLVHEAAKSIKEGKGATHYGIASAIARIVSLPMLINGGGAQLLVYPELDATEREALQRSARIVKDATDGIAAPR
jgi:L-lactate dehydrogenase